MKGKGKILCNKCSATFKEKDRGVCPKCGGAVCHIRVYWKGETHKYFRGKDQELFYYNTASLQLALMQEEIRKHTFVPAEWKTEHFKKCVIKSVCGRWLAETYQDVSLRRKKPSTYRSYRNIAELRILTSPIAKEDIRDSSRERLRAFFKDLEGKRLSQRTITLTRVILKRIYRFAYDEGLIEYIPEFPESGMRGGKSSAKKAALDYEEQEYFFSKVPFPYRNLIFVLADTGMRPGEICALKIEDVNQLKREIVVRRTYSDRVLVEPTTKDARPQDKARYGGILPLTERAFSIIMDQIKGRFPNDFVFLQKNGKHYLPGILTRAWAKVGSGVTLYEATRHSYGSQIWRETKDMKTVQACMRQANISSTQNYVHSVPEDLRHAIVRRGSGPVTSLSDFRENKARKEDAGKE